MKNKFWLLILVVIFVMPTFSHAFSLGDVGKVISDGVKKIEKVVKGKKTGAREPDKDPPTSEDPVPGHKNPVKPKVN